MKKKILCAAACAAVWAACLMLPASIAEGNVRNYDGGQPVTEGWVTTEGNTYYFDADGNASVLKCKIDGDYYVFDKEGRLLLPSSKKVVRVETQDGGFQRYYVDTQGKAISGWSADKTYYFDKTGEMATGIQVIKKKFYWFDANGKWNEKKTQNIRKAAKYEHPFSSLKKYIGNPKKSKYYDSCYGPGKDGILTYNGFKVYTYQPVNGAEIFMGAE
ncbi:MAG: hypothetical protein K2N87_14030 [Eubacterium sp.]|nr:hypothetical protein [Eubacterium sp.]